MDKPIEHYEGKALAAADKWYDASVKKVGGLRGCERALENAITDLRRARDKVKPNPP